MPDKRVTELTAIDTVTDVDLLLLIDDPSGTAVNKKATVAQLLAPAARTNVSNTFTGDQTVDGDLFVTGEVNPVRLAAQKVKIDLLTGTPPGDPTGSRTVMSRSLVSGLSIRHDEDAAQGKIVVGNYDTQMYQPLLLEVETLGVHTGQSPGVRFERLRVHPLGGVTLGVDHTLDPGAGALALDTLTATASVTAATLDLAEGPIPLDPPPATGRLYALDVNGYTQVEMRDANANAVRFASDNIVVSKVSGVAITRGQCVYLSGAIGANPLVGLARSDSITTMPTIGLALDSGVVNDFIRVLVAGTLQLLNTAAFTEGDRLYVSPTTAGSLTTTRPLAPAYAQRLGFVTRSHATAGEVLVLTTSVDDAPRLHHATHEPGGTDALVLTAPSRLLGRGDSGAGPLQELTLGGGLTMNGTELQAPRSSVLVNYTYNNATTEPPAAGQVRVNALFPFTAATKLWMRTVSADGQDVYWGLMIIEAGMTLLLQDKDDHTLYVRFTVTAAPVDKGLYVEIPVAHFSHGNAIVTASQVLLQRSGGGTATALLDRLDALEARLALLEQR